MLRRSLCIAVALSAAVLSLGVPANSQGMAFNNSFGQFWGTWLHKVEGVSLPALVTIHVDGTLTVTSGFTFGAGFPMRISPIHGVWERVGPKTIHATSLFFLFDENGVLTGYPRNRCRLQYSNDFNSYKGTEFMETISCSASNCPDPLDLKVTWTPSPPATGFAISATRLKLVPPGPLAP